MVSSRLRYRFWGEIINSCESCDCQPLLNSTAGPGIAPGWKNTP